MFVTRRRFEQVEAAREFEKFRANINMELWMEQFAEIKGLSKELSITDASLTAAESALRHKEGIIDDLQAEVYELTCRVQAARAALCHP